jgi:hypothetical protein
VLNAAVLFFCSFYNDFFIQGHRKPFALVEGGNNWSFKVAMLLWLVVLMQ